MNMMTTRVTLIATVLVALFAVAASAQTLRTGVVSGTTLTPALRAAPVAPASNPPAFGTVPGSFAIRTYLKGTYLTARDGGHHSVDAVITTATTAGYFEKFVLTGYQPDFTTIETPYGYYVSAAGSYGGGYDATQTLQTELLTPQSDIALFRLEGPNAFGASTIKTWEGYFLTALGGGGKPTAAFHTDATQASYWEWYSVVKCGELGSGYTYAIRPTGTVTGFLHASFGGGQTTNAVTALNPLDAFAKFKLIQQSDGSYALQTSDNVNVVTAVGGGGFASGNNLQTDRTQVQAWEMFRIVDQGDCTYTIETANGWYLAVGPGGAISTRISDPNLAPSIGYNAKFELLMIGL